MPTSKKPRRKHRPQTQNTRTLRTQPWKVRAVFEPLETILDELERNGTLTVVSAGPMAGTPVFRPEGENTWYAAAPALRGLIETFELHEGRCGRPMPLEPLRRLARKFELGMMIFPRETAEARASMAVMIKESHNMEANYAVDLVQTFQTTIELERLKLVRPAETESRALEEVA